MPDQENRDLVEQELRDERARRREAEQRLEELTDRAELWRGRAEERSERIERLLEAQRRKGDTLRKWVQALRGRDQASVEQEANQPPTAVEPVEHPWPTMRSVVVASVVSDPAKNLAIAAFDQRSGEQLGEADLDRADFVVVEPTAVRTLDADKRGLLESWAAQQARQPLIVWAEDPDWASVAELLAPTDVKLASSVQTATTAEVHHVPGCFDPAIHSPLRASEATTTPVMAPLDKSTLEHPTIRQLESAASGGDGSASATAARRWAFREHAPWVRAAQLAELAGIDAPSPTPAIAAIVVSNRPADIPSTVEMMLAQTHGPLEVIVGLHGAEPTSGIGRLVERADIRIEVLAFDERLTLGECLNLAATQASTPLLAKIDDDDFYGPGHLEDGFQALSYSGADIAGRGTHFTYVSNRDTTVLRRPGQEEMFIEGSPNGASLVFKRSVWEEVGFPHKPRHVDTGYLRAARSLGARVYAGSRWEFCYVRRPDGHTWDAEDEVFLAGSESAWKGFHPERVEVPDVGPI